MGQTDVLEKEASGNGEMKIESYEVDYNKLKGRVAAFLITPLGHGSVFSREQFSEEHRMFQQTAKEFGETRILPVREKLNVLNRCQP